MDGYWKRLQEASTRRSSFVAHLKSDVLEGESQKAVGVLRVFLRELLHVGVAVEGAAKHTVKVPVNL